MVTYRFDINLGENSHIDRHVWHENVEVVKLFLLQHGFPEKSIYQIYATENPILNNRYRLIPVKLKRNGDDETIEIYTTSEILHDILTTFTEYWSSILEEIPYLITHTGHGIIHALNDLIYALPYVFLPHYVQYEGMDEIPQESLVHDIQYTKVFSSENRDNGYATIPDVKDIEYIDFRAFESYVFDALELACRDNIDVYNEPLPITIECYISFFIKYFSCGGEE